MIAHFIIRRAGVTGLGTIAELFLSAPVQDQEENLLRGWNIYF